MARIDSEDWDWNVVAAWELVKDERNINFILYSGNGFIWDSNLNEND